MSDDFYSVWRELTGKEGEEQLPLCPVVLQFKPKLDDVIFKPLASLGQNVSRAQVAQAKYLLQEEYQAWKKSLPHSHGVMSGKKHRCLADIYDEAFDRLHLLDLTLRPTLNLILDYGELSQQQQQVAAPSPPAVNQIADIFLGEVEDE